MRIKQLVFLTTLLLSTYYPIYSQTAELDSLTLKLAFQKPDSSKVNTSLKIIEILYNKQDYKRAIQFIDQTQQLSQNINYIKGSARVIYYKAMIFVDKDDYNNALNYFLKSRELYNSINDKLGVANVDNGIGLIEIKKGNYQKGLVVSLKAISVLESKNSLPNLSTAYNNLAKAYFYTKKFDKALEYNFKAVKVIQTQKDTSNLSDIYKNIADIYSIIQTPDQAIEYYKKTLEISNTNQNLKGEILPKIGLEYLNLQRYDKATKYLVEGLRVNRKTKNKEGILDALNGLARFNIISNRYNLASSQIAEASTIVKELDVDKRTLENYNLKIKLDSARGNFKEAFMFLKEYQNLKNKIQEKEQQKKLASLTEYNITNTLKEKEQNKEALITNQTGNTNTKQIQFEKLTDYALLASLLIAIFILIFILIRQKIWNQQNKKLEGESKQTQKENTDIFKKIKTLEKANSVKDKLFSIVSHDLKDSVSSLKSFIDLLKDGSLSKEEFDQLIPELSKNADNASLLLINLLNWSKSQMESLKPKPDYFDIQNVFKEKTKLVEQKMETKGIVLIDQTIPETVYADKSMVEIIIQNLLINAVKFCKKGDSITILNYSLKCKVVFEVQDTGLGISEDKLAKLFENSFTTLGTSNEKGTGLGLTISKELVELNHGKIWVESTKNTGSKFFVELPKDPVLN